MPEQCIDPVITAAQIVLALQNIRARKISTYDKAVISVCTIHGGDAYNIIPGEVSISGSVRTFSKEVRAEVEKQIKQISNGIAAANGAEVIVLGCAGMSGMKEKLEESIDVPVIDSCEAGFMMLYGMCQMHMKSSRACMYAPQLPRKTKGLHETIKRFYE